MRGAGTLAGWGPGAGREDDSSAVRDAAAGGPTSIVEVVVGASGLEVYERSGDGAVDALEERLGQLGLRLRVRRRGMCG